jgi:chorismate mutase
MSPSSRASNLAPLRERLAQLNSEFFIIMTERRSIALKIQDLKENKGRYSHYDPEREMALFVKLEKEIKELSLKELLAFSLIMEDQAMAMAPGSYPGWSQSCHLIDPAKELTSMINPLLLKVTHAELFSRLHFNSEFSFLRDFSLP